MIVLDYLTLVTGSIGAAVIVWGVLCSVYRWLRFEIACLRGAPSCRGRESIRHQLVSYLLLGLEFMIAADIIRSIRNPTLQEIAVLASIVIIRTVISFFLDRELADTPE